MLHAATWMPWCWLSAGLGRLGLEDYISELIDPEVMTPRQGRAPWLWRCGPLMPAA